MAFLHYFLLCLSSFCLITFSFSQPPPATTKLFLRVRKDSATNLHVATVTKRTPPVPLQLLVDLNGPFVTINCEAGGPYLSSTYDAPACRSTQCSRAVGPNHTCKTCSSRGAPRPGCHNGTCGVTVGNPVTRRRAVGELAQDALTLRATVARGLPSFPALVPRFLFVCAPPELFYRGLPRNAVGVAGLGHTQLSLPNQVASQFGFRPRFAICLPRGIISGAIFFGDVPLFPGGIDVTQRLTYAPLSVTEEGDYFISLTGIRVNNRPVRTFLRRAIISTTSAYSVLEHTLYSAVIPAFIRHLRGIPQVGPVGPFRVCFDARRIRRTEAGLAVPPIDLVLRSTAGTWRITGQNSMVEARPGVLCLAVVDGGRWPGRGAMVIGAYQLEDILVRFDLGKSQVGFSSSLVFQGTSCSNFSFIR